MLYFLAFLRFCPHSLVILWPRLSASSSSRGYSGRHRWLWLPRGSDACLACRSPRSHASGRSGDVYIDYEGVLLQLASALGVFVCVAGASRVSECSEGARASVRWTFCSIMLIPSMLLVLQHILKLNPTSMEVRVSECCWRGLRADYVIHCVLFGHSLCCFPCYWPPSITVLIACCSSFPRAGECHATRADAC